jgi:HSP20 family protein
MTLVRRNSPFSELVSLRQAMDRLFEDSFVRPGRYLAGFDAAMPLDVRSTPDNLEVKASLPGVKPDDVDITVEGGTLSIAASSRADEREDDGDYLVHEIRRGSVTRTIALPTGYEADKATASFDGGVLTLTIPRAEQLKPRQIRITPQSGDANGKVEAPRVETRSQD